MASAPPTRREVLILAVLLAVLIFLGNSDSSPSIPERNSPPPPPTNSSATPLHEAYTLKPIDTRLTWGSSPPPETTIVAHVPGLFPSFQNTPLLIFS